MKCQFGLRKVPWSAALLAKGEGRTYLKRCSLSAVALLAAALLLGASAWAQETTGSISGTVKDPSGAVVPNAKVVLHDTEKNADVRQTTTNGAGDFAFLELPVGRYSFTVEASGFRRFVQADIVLNVDDKLTFFPTLEVGVASQEVKVEAAPLQVNIENATAVGVVTGTQVRELTMNNRVWEQLMILVPGVSDSNSGDEYYVGATNPFGGSSTNTVGFQINGGRREETNFQVDGMDNMDRGSNLTLLSFPSVDAISEFRIVRGVYDPELGRSGGAQVNVLTRSGTSDLHGGVYEFFRNNVLNSNQWANNAATPAVPRPILRYNDFGGTVGGPVYIPHVYEQRDKTFFFVSEEARRTIVYSTATATAPTTGMMTGTFLHPVCTNWTNTNGVAGACAAYGTNIPSTSINAVAAAYVKDIYSKFPPINSGTFNIVSNLTGVYNFHEDMVKVDHSFKNKLTIYGKYLHDTIPTIEPGGLFTGYPVNGVATTSTNSPGHEYNLHATLTASPTFLVDGGYGFSYGAIISREIGLSSSTASPDVTAAIGSLMPFTPLLGRVPTIGFSSGTGVSGYGPYNDYNRNQTAFINVSKVFGGHTLKFGAIGYHYNKHENLLSGSPNGSFSFNNQNAPTATTAGGTICGTGSLPACPNSFEQNWANFLLGNDSGFAQANLDVTANIFDNQFEYYGQDTWRVRPNLTVTYGLRHSFFRQPTDGSGSGGSSRLINFDPALYDPTKAPCVLPNGNLDVTLTDGIPTSSACNPNYTPLNGFIYASATPVVYNGFTGMKSPFGSKVGKEFNRAIAPRLGIAWDPFGNGKTSVRAGYGMFFDNGLEFGNPELNVANNPGFLTNLSFSNTTFAAPTGATTTVTSTGAAAINDRMPINYKSPYMEQWSLDIQRQIQTTWLVDIGYYGNGGTHLPGFIDSNAPAPGAWKKCAAPNSCTSGPNTIQFIAAASGTGAGGAACNGAPCVTSSDTSLLNVLRPYVGFAGADDFEDIYTSNYNALQMQVQKKLSGSAMVNIAYTWSHGLTTYQADRSTGGVMPESYTNIAENYGPNIADRRHVITGNFVWDLPWMRSQKGALGHLLGGWEFSGVQTMQTGLPLTPTITGAGFVDTAGVGCLGTSPCSLRPDLIGNPNWGPHTFNAFTTGEWFNPIAYQCYGTAKYCVPYTGQSGIGDSSPGTARGPGFWRTDLGLFKNIRFSERFTGQIRIESFNTFNHVNPIQPGTGGSSLSLSSTVYDEVLLARDPRLIQIAMKLNF